MRALLEVGEELGVVWWATNINLGYVSVPSFPL